MLFAKIHVMKVLGMSVRKPTCLRAVESDLDAFSTVFRSPSRPRKYRRKSQMLGPSPMKKERVVCDICAVRMSTAPYQ